MLACSLRLSLLGALVRFEIRIEIHIEEGIGVLLLTYIHYRIDKCIYCPVTILCSYALSSSSAGGSLLYSDLSDLASSGSNEAREGVDGKWILQSIKRDKDPGCL